MTPSVLLRGVRLLSPGREESIAGVRWAGSQLTDCGPEAHKLSADLVIEADGLTAIPGMVDLHTHGAAGADVCDGTLEAIRKIAQAKLKEGVTTFLPTTLTLPYEQLETAAASVAAYRKHQEFAKTPAMHIEGPFINPKCVGAQNPAFVRDPDPEEIFRLREIAPIGVVSLACEQPNGLECISALAKAGIATSLAHTAATYAQFLAAKQAGLKHLTHFCNQMTPLHHREIGIVGAGLRDLEVKVELIADGLHLCREMVETVFAVKSSQRALTQMMLITDSMAASHLGDGAYNIGGLPVTVQGGAARLANGSLAGSTLLLNQAIKNVLEWTDLPAADLIGCTAWHQVRSLGTTILSKIGRLIPGAQADVVLVDADWQVRKVFVDGQLRYEN